MPDRRYRDAEYLREQYLQQERSMRDIADECGVHKTTVWRWLHRHDIPTRDIDEHERAW